MESRQSYWVQLLPLPLEDRHRLMSARAVAVHRLTFRGVNRKTSKVIGKNKPKNLLWSRIDVIFRYSNNRMRFFSYLYVQNLTIQKSFQQ